MHAPTALPSRRHRPLTRRQQIDIPNRRGSGDRSVRFGTVSWCLAPRRVHMGVASEVQPVHAQAEHLVVAQGRPACCSSWYMEGWGSSGRAATRGPFEAPRVPLPSAFSSSRRKGRRPARAEGASSSSRRWATAWRHREHAHRRWYCAPATSRAPVRGGRGIAGGRAEWWMRRAVDLVRHMCTPRPEVIGDCSEHASVAKQALERALRRTCCTSSKPPSRALQQCPWAPKRPLDCAAPLRQSVLLLARE